ncbi:GTP-binding protein EngB [Penicillium chermesinum]|nr:GTP-binding protein EngB [Penicillium chermesinum]
MNAFGIGGTKGGESKVVLLDMPGYGKASRAEWGLEIMKYLQGRRHKKQAKAGASAIGIQRLQTLLHKLKPDIQPDPRISEGPGALGEILTCSADTFVSPGQALGVDSIRWAILAAAGIDGSLQGVKPAHEIGTQISES